jgi:hypothetical protein
VLQADAATVNEQHGVGFIAIVDGVVDDFGTLQEACYVALLGLLLVGSI